MARVKLRCIMGCPGFKKSYREKGLLKIEIHSYSTVLNCKGGGIICEGGGFSSNL